MGFRPVHLHSKYDRPQGIVNSFYKEKVRTESSVQVRNGVSVLIGIDDFLNPAIVLLMNTKSKAEVAPAQIGQHTITLSKGGTKEKTIPLSQLDIPDLWHIAQAEMDLRCRESILLCWHYAHDLKRTVEEIATEQDSLIEALTECVAAMKEWGYGKTGVCQQARAAIAKADVAPAKVRQLQPSPLTA